MIQSGLGKSTIIIFLLAIWANILVAQNQPNMTIFNTENSEIPDNVVLDVAIDKYGNKWMATSGGLAKFDGKNWSVFDTTNSDIPANLTVLFIFPATSLQ